MSKPIHKLGTEKPVETGTTSTLSDKDAKVVVVEGMYANLEDAEPEEYVPEGYALESSSLVPVENGFGRLSVNCIRYDAYDDANLTPVRTTFRIDMQEVQYDLEDHPALQGVKSTVLKWLATDESVRMSADKFYYSDEDGGKKEIDDDDVKKFCKAYAAGIKTFNRYYPVIEKISIWKNPPGLVQSGRSFTGGNPKFSREMGKFDVPPLTLVGFDEKNWYKSKDTWAQNENKTWTRTEQWTYTPEGSEGEHAWIYRGISDGGNE